MTADGFYPPALSGRLTPLRTAGLGVRDAALNHGRGLWNVNADGQILFTVQRSQAGLRAMHIRRPCQVIA